MLKSILAFALAVCVGHTPFAATAGAARGCCDTAMNLASAVAQLSQESGAELTTLGVPSARRGAALRSLAKAQEFLGQGVEEGAGDCRGRKALQKFRYAHGWIVNYRQILEGLGLQDSDIDNKARNIGEDIADLLAGVCTFDGGGST